MAVHHSTQEQVRACAEFLREPGGSGSTPPRVLRDLTLPALRSVVSDVAWRSRAAAEDLPDPDLVLGDGGGCDRADWGTRVRFSFVGQRLRFDFRFSSVAALVARWDAAVGPDDALMRSLDAFALLGRRHDAGTACYGAALRMPDADHRSRHVCLAGMWSAHHLPEQGTRMLELCDEMEAGGEADANVHFRRASAHRKLRDYERALDAVDTALEMLGPGSTEVNQDYLRERELIGAALAAGR